MMFFAGLAAAALAGCSSPGGGGAVPDAGRDTAVYEVAVSLPDGCPPAAGNANGVGQPCTPGGGECKGSLHCSCDQFLGVQLTGIPCLCTLLNFASGTIPDGGTPCTNVPMSYCGAGATCCPYQSVGYYCAPDVCLADGVCPPVAPGP
jgi:hypothetical protein